MRKIQNISFVGLLLMGVGTQSPAQQLQKGWQVGAALPVALDGLKDWTNQSVGFSLDGAYQMPLPGDKAWFRVGLGLNYFPGKEKAIAAFQQAGVPADERDPLIETWKNDTRTISLTGVQINLDLLFPVGSTPLSLLTGISLNTWQKKVSGQYPHDWRDISGEWFGEWVWYDGWVWDGYYEPYYPIDRLGRDNSVSGTVKNVFGKYGLRLGAEYAVNDRFTISATLQLTELGSDREFLADKFLVEYDSNGREIPGTKNEVEGKHNVNPSWIQVGVRYRF